MLNQVNIQREAPIANKLLAALTPVDYRHMLMSLESVTLTFGDVLYEAGDLIEYIYFPIDSLISLLTAVDSLRALEVGIVGHEGLVGTSVVLGAEISPVRVMVQGAGLAMRMKVALFRITLRKNQAFQDAVLLYLHALMRQIAQTAACNRFHMVEERLARWLLLTRDHVDSNHFYLTHEFLANLLGIRRVGVTKAAHSLKLRKLIEYSRGNIHIIDGAGLESAACSCYALVQDKTSSGQK